MTSHAMLLIHSIDRIRHLELTLISHYGDISLYRTAWYEILVRPSVSRVREYGKYCQKREIIKKKKTSNDTDGIMLVAYVDSRWPRSCIKAKYNTRMVWTSV